MCREEFGKSTGALLRGSRDGTPRQERVERGRPRLMRVATATEGARPQAKVLRSDEESDESTVPMKAVKAAGGKGLYSMMRPQPGRSGDCGNITKNPE
jgi:hypothetical protein